MVEAISHIHVEESGGFMRLIISPKMRGLHCFLNDVDINNHSIRLTLVSESFSTNDLQVCLARVHAAREPRWHGQLIAPSSPKKYWQILYFSKPLILGVVPPTQGFSTIVTAGPHHNS
jgi:hypothetical protein